ncbi:hypothetical protein SUGI_0994560 [Cryptomeria japonica]|uniref:DNA replication complex GINS protein SLD5 n=1 Tax=Cryptomeria japonica TaxID=3369 RepID=UPI002414D00E|nr:DNA replication complex GINS protein SLD5 [Cryptomeria japonica]GLJ47098.1 hypothetical protein SUGI_0994560 [Cryptomeria japonica]
MSSSENGGEGGGDPSSSAPDNTNATTNEAFWTQDSAFDTAEDVTDVELLKRAWRNEKAAPEILPFRRNLVERAREQIQLMEDTIAASAESGTDDLMLSLYRMDLDRTLFLLRSYLRTRLLKIEKYVLHVLKSEELWNKLSEAEQKFAQKCTDALQKHLEQSVLSRLPYGYQSMLRQAISSEEDDMVPEPKLDTFVFCKIRDAIGSVQMDEKGEDIVNLMEDDFFILRYKPIQRLVETGQIDLV